MIEPIIKHYSLTCRKLKKKKSFGLIEIGNQKNKKSQNSKLIWERNGYVRHMRGTFLYFYVIILLYIHWIDLTRDYMWVHIYIHTLKYYIETWLSTKNLLNPSLHWQRTIGYHDLFKYRYNRHRYTINQISHFHSHLSPIRKLARSHKQFPNNDKRSVSLQHNNPQMFAYLGSNKLFG